MAVEHAATRLTQRADGSYTHPDDPGEPSTKVGRVSITDDEGEVLALLAAGGRVLELGTGLGVSTRHLAAVAEHVVTVDIDPWVHAHVSPELSQLPNVECVGDRDAVVGPFDLVFIDGDHRPPAVLADVMFARQQCPAGIVVAHDATSLRSTLDVLGDWLYLDSTHGLAIMKTGW